MPNDSEANYLLRVVHWFGCAFGKHRMRPWDLAYWEGPGHASVPRGRWDICDFCGDQRKGNNP